LNFSIRHLQSAFASCFDFAGKSIVREEFINAIKSNQSAFGIDQPENVTARLADYYELIQKHNPILHLVGPCTPEEFATRHILESLTLLESLPANTRFADIGPGAGLPSIPCLIARDDLSAVLIESKEKKTAFLRGAAAELGLDKRAKIINKQFSEVTRPHVTHVTCRALDKFAEKLPQLLKWSGERELLLFGGASLNEALDKAKRKYQRRLMPLSDRRYLFCVSAPTIS
jgi:16S rRNA (guanine527-N7)-methyltransferase